MLRHSWGRREKRSILILCGKCIADNELRLLWALSTLGTCGKLFDSCRDVEPTVSVRFYNIVPEGALFLY